MTGAEEELVESGAGAATLREHDDREQFLADVDRVLADVAGLPPPGWIVPPQERGQPPGNEPSPKPA